MKKLLWIFTFLFCMNVYAQDKLNLYIWSEYIDPEVISTFEKRFNCKVQVDLFEDAESLLAKLEGGGTKLYDVIVPTDYIVPVLKARGFVSKLRHENIPNLKNVDSKFINPPFDPKNEYTAPYQWGTVGIYMRKKPGVTVDQSWGLFFDPTKAPGSFVMIDSMRDAFTMALKYKGLGVNTKDPKALLEAKALLLNAKKRSRGFDAPIGGKNKVLASGVTMAVVYNGDAARGMTEDPETTYFVPKEGSQIWIDNLAITSGAPHRDLAEKFINFILEPEIGAKISNFNQYATPNKASIPMINKEDLDNTAIYPTEEIMAKLEFLEDLGDATKLYDEIWTAVKAE